MEPSLITISYNCWLDIITSPSTYQLHLEKSAHPYFPDAATMARAPSATTLEVGGRDFPGRLYRINYIKDNYQPKLKLTIPWVLTRWYQRSLVLAPFWIRSISVLWSTANLRSLRMFWDRKDNRESVRAAQGTWQTRDTPLWNLHQVVAYEGRQMCNMHRKFLKHWVYVFSVNSSMHKLESSTKTWRS